MITTESSEEILHDLIHGLIHDIRQPLGNLETSVFYLDMVLDHPTGRVGEQMRMMERQIAQAVQLLHRAAAELREVQAQREGADSSAGTCENRLLTNSTTAGVR